MQTKLLELRKKKKLSQEKMAQLLGISKVSYNHKENGIVEFKSDEMFRVSKIMGLSIDQIFLPRGHQNGD